MVYTMNRNSKITLAVILGLMAVLVVICIAGVAITLLGGRAYIKQAVITDPGKVTTAAHAIIDYDLPPGYQEVSLTRFGLTRLVHIQNETRGANGFYKPILILSHNLTQSTGGLNEETQQQIFRSTQRMLGRGELTSELKEKKVITVRSQDVTLFIYEGKAEDGTAIRQISSGYFEGKTGMVTITIIGAQEGWDQEAVDLFIGSLR